ncbi:hypothetical protein BAE30_09990 [Acidithiobacillus caldus]|jgi:hypothetical protein|uniref:Uncharacterized protein n=1 Tax=Acidithiobacillus caldus TaxID=33059 RepID=A0A1E7YU44_9PROT|nr:hypothetical protein BAE30_09990 [Acidithiobacillus caldus]
MLVHRSAVTHNPSAVAVYIQKIDAIRDPLPKFEVVFNLFTLAQALKPMPIDREWLSVSR